MIKKKTISDVSNYFPGKIARLRFNKKVKIAFISIPTPILMSGNQVFSPNRTNYFPFSQIILATCLKKRLEKENIPWSVIFSDFKSVEDTNRWDEKLDAYGEVKYNEKSLTKCMIGDGLKRLTDELGDKDIICITSNFTFESNITKMVIRTIKQQNKHSLIIVGGQDVSARPEYYLSIGTDIAAVGEADFTLPEFISRLYRGKAIHDIFKDGMLCSRNIATNLDELPPLNIELIHNTLHRFNESGGGGYLDSIIKKGHFAYYQSSRGCYRDCNFCLGRLKKKSEISLERYYKDVDWYKKNSIITLMFCEDNLMQRLNKGQKGEKELLKMFDYLREQNMIWEFPVGLEIGKFFDPRTNKINNLLLQTMLWNNDSLNDFIGLFRLLFPIENSLANDGNEKNIFKKMKSLDISIRLLQEMFQMGVPQINLGIMFGLPYENHRHLQTIKQQLEIITQLRCTANTKSTRTIKSTINYSVFCATPLPGTPFYQQMGKEKRIKYDIEKDPELWNLHLSVLQGDYYKPHEIASLRQDLLEMFDSQLEMGKVKLHLNPNREPQLVG